MKCAVDAAKEEWLFIMIIDAEKVRNNRGGHDKVATDGTCRASTNETNITFEGEWRNDEEPREADQLVGRGTRSMLAVVQRPYNAAMLALCNELVMKCTRA